MSLLVAVLTCESLHCRAVMNNYQAAAAGFGPPASPHAAGGRAGFPAASSPGPALDVYGSAADSVGYVQAASPQPSGFPTIAVSRAPLNYTPVMLINVIKDVSLINTNHVG